MQDETTLRMPCLGLGRALQPRERGGQPIGTGDSVRDWPSIGQCVAIPSQIQGVRQVRLVIKEVVFSIQHGQLTYLNRFGRLIQRADHNAAELTRWSTDLALTEGNMLTLQKNCSARITVIKRRMVGLVYRLPVSKLQALEVH